MVYRRRPFFILPTPTPLHPGAHCSVWKGGVKMEEGRVNRAGLNHVWLLKKEQGRGEDKERRETERQRKNTSKPPQERHKNRENEKQESYESQKTLWRFKKGDGRPFKSLFLPCYGSELKTGLPHAYHRNTCCLWSGFSTLNLWESPKGHLIWVYRTSVQRKTCQTSR